MSALDRYWKILMWGTILFLVFSVAVLVNNIATTGSFLKRDIDLSGGKLITVGVDDADLNEIEKAIP